MLFDELLGSKISQISRVCDLVCMQLTTPKGNKLCLHIQSFFRIIKDRDVIISSEDMYRCASSSNYESFEWDVPGNSIYDQALEKIREDLYNAAIVEYNRNDIGDMSITFENNLILQILVDTTESEEKYRIFNDTDCDIVNS